MKSRAHKPLLSITPTLLNRHSQYVIQPGCKRNPVRISLRLYSISVHIYIVCCFKFVSSRISGVSLKERLEFRVQVDGKR